MLSELEFVEGEGRGSFSGVIAELWGAVGGVFG